MSFKGRSAKLLVILICLLVAISLTAFGCAEKKEDEEDTTTKETYKIGVVLSSSGGAAPLGQPEQKALLLIEDQINNEGGIDGHPIDFIIEDDESDPATATTAVTKLINQDKVPVIIGSSTSGATLAMREITMKEEIPHVCMAANTGITNPADQYSWIFRTPPTDAMAIEKVLEYLSEVITVAKIAILHDANAFGVGGADELQSKAPSLGIEVVARESYGSADTDMTAQLTKIQQTDAQAIVVWGTNPGPASIAVNMQQLGMTIPFIGSHGIANQKFIELAGDAANGVVFPAGRLLIPSSIPEGSDWANAVEQFSKDYEAEYDEPINTFAAHGYDAGLIVTEAMKTGGTDPAKIRDAIEEITDLVGIDGVYTFSPDDHDGLTADDLIWIKIENGEWTQVK